MKPELKHAQEVGEYWRILGHEIAARVKNQGSEAMNFSVIATEVLQSVSAPEVSALKIADWILEEESLPKQVNWSSGFGEPPLVVYENPQFFLEVLFWFPSRTGIHGHGFEGAFRVLDGYSLQVEYLFQEGNVGDEKGIREGKLVAKTFELILPGTVYPIVSGGDFSHTVAHMGNPSLTLVARNHGKKGSQYLYHRCGFANLSNWEVEPLTRKAEVLAALIKSTPEFFGDRLRTFCARAGKYEFYVVLEKLVGILGLGVFSKSVSPLIESELAQHHSLPWQAIKDGIRSAGAWSMVKSMPDASKQFRLAVSELFPDEMERDELLRARYPTKEPSVLLQEWQKKTVRES